MISGMSALAIFLKRICRKIDAKMDSFQELVLNGSRKLKNLLKKYILKT
jgi:hypothetical protein